MKSIIKLQQIFRNQLTIKKIIMKKHLIHNFLSILNIIQKLSDEEFINYLQKPEFIKHVRLMLHLIPKIKLLKNLKKNYRKTELFISTLLFYLKPTIIQYNNPKAQLISQKIIECLQNIYLLTNKQAKIVDYRKFIFQFNRYRYYLIIEYIKWKQADKLKIIKHANQQYKHLLLLEADPTYTNNVTKKKEIILTTLKKVIGPIKTNKWLDQIHKEIELFVKDSKQIYQLENQRLVHLLLLRDEITYENFHNKENSYIQDFCNIPKINYNCSTFQKGNFEEFPKFLEFIFTTIKKINEKASKQLRDIIDVDIVTSQINKNIIDCILPTLNQIIDVILLLESPIENKNTTIWKKKIVNDIQQYNLPLTTTVPKIINYILDKLYKIQEGVQIFNIITLQTFIKRSGIQYEQQKFNQNLQNKEVTLLKTKKWIHEIIQENMLSNNHNELLTILSLSFIHLLKLDNPLTIYKQLPETLINDKYLLEEIQNELQILCVTISLNFVLNAFFLRKHIVKQCTEKEFLDELVKRVTYLLLNEKGDITVKTLINTLYSWISQKSNVVEYKDELMKLIDNTVNIENSLYQMSKKRILHLCKLLLCKEDSLFTDMIYKYKMYDFRKAIVTIYQKIERILLLNKEIYHNHYNTILESYVMMSL